MHLLGHEAQRALLRETRAHALLFVGPERVGRRQAARYFAAYLNCRAPEGRPCGSCESCRLMAEDAHPDYREVAPLLLTTTGRVSRRPEVRIAQLVPREGENPDEALSRWLETPPRYAARVGVIDSADSLTVSAANAFLKMLEEPPGHARIVLIAPSPQAVLPTIASRCAVIRFGAVTLPASDHPLSRLGRLGDLRRAEENPEDFAELRDLVAAYVRALTQGLEAALEAADALEKRWLAPTATSPADLLLAELSTWPPTRYARAAHALDTFTEALASYAAPGLAVQHLTLELRHILGEDRR
jgi:DNA polymerase III subunit delta'